MTAPWQAPVRLRPAIKLFRFAAVCIGLIVAVVYYVSLRISGKIIGFQPPEMAAAQYTPKDVIGDLGGMKVRIPKHYAEYVEYDGDPGFGEKRKGPRPERTFDSRLRSFGVDARFPDMKGLESWKMRQERSRQPLKENMWLSIGIVSGEAYPGDGFMDARVRRTLPTPNDSFKGHWDYTYERMPEDEYGLEVWRLSGIDPRTGKPARESDTTRDMYVHRDLSGKVNTFIACGRPSVPTGIGNCKLEISLAQKAQVSVTVSFRRGLLPEWKRIQQSAFDLLLSFEVDPSAVSTDIPRTVSTQQTSHE